MPARSRTRWRILHRCLVVTILMGVATAQERPRAFEDPAPPRVSELTPAESPEAKDVPGLLFHAPPTPLALSAKTSDWPSFLGSRRDGHTDETHLLMDLPAKGPKKVWEMTRGDGYACPVIQGRHLVFTHRESGQVHIDCLDPATGRRYWRFSSPCDYRGKYISNSGPRSTPIIDGDFVYVHGVEGSLRCLELRTGRVRWSRNLPKEFNVSDDFFGVVSSPLIHGDLLIQNVGAPKGPGVAAFNKHDGRLVWGADREWAQSCASPVIGTLRGAPTLCVLAGGDSRPPTGGLLILDPTSGALQHRLSFRSKTYESVLGSSPVIGDGWVFISSAYGVGSALVRATAKDTFETAWKLRAVGLQFSNAIHRNGFLYAVDGKSDRPGAVVCIDPTTGRETSRTELNWEEAVTLRGKKKEVSFSIGEGSLLSADGDFLCLGDNGHLLRLQYAPKGVTVRWRTWLFGANECWTPLVLSRGLLYVCQNKRERFGDAPPRLICYDLRRPEK